MAARRRPGCEYNAARLGRPSPCDPPSPQAGALHRLGAGRLARPRPHGPRRRLLARVGGLAAGGLDRHALLARDGRRDHRVPGRRGGAPVLALQVPRAPWRRRRPDPRPHAARDRLDRWRGGDPRRARRRDLHPASGDPHPAELGPERPPARRPRPGRGGADEAASAERQVAEHLRERPAVHLALHVRAELQERPAQLGVLVHHAVRADRHDGHARHRRPGRGALVVDPEARRQVRRRAGLHEHHVVQDPRPARGHEVPRAVRRAVRPQPREHDRVSGRDEAEPVRGLARPAAQRGQAGGRRRPAPAPARRPRPAARRLTSPSRKRTPTPRMATQEITAPPAVPQVVAHNVERERTGWTSWVTTTDHKRIGIMYLVLTFVFFLLGGTEALLIRLQLSQADNTLLTPQTYNELITMHGTTMIFLFVVPVMAGFANYFLPLMIGARDMAFPRLNALSYWLLLFGGIVFYSSLFWQPPEAGWFSYTPLSSEVFTPSGGQDAWIYLIHITGISSLVGAINFYVTIVNMRAPGMSWGRLPLFIWGILIYAVLLIIALPVVAAAVTMLLTDRHFGTHFYDAS